MNDELSRTVELGVPGLSVGHWTGAGTGVTVLLSSAGVVGSAEVRGGAPATRELALLDVTKTIARVDAVVLSGGSAFGLAAADGVMRFLADRGQGFPTAAGPIPIVCAASLFDLRVSNGVTPGPEHGIEAALAATSGGPVPVGRVGAGTGATVGKWRGLDSGVPGGLGVVAVQVGDVNVAVVAVVNAFGDVVDADGSVIAGSTAAHDDPLPAAEGFGTGELQNTTLVVVATDAGIDKVGCRLLSESAHDGFARALRPAHSGADGDVAFTLATGARDIAPLDELRRVVPDLVAAAIRSAVE